jgi:PqqD family protein of HPr-rel-A system
MIKWRFNHATDLHFKQFVGQGCVVFNAASGQTHYLAESAIAILNLLRQHSLDLSDIFSTLKQEYDDLPPDADFQKYISSIISQLDSIGFIEPDSD